MQSSLVPETLEYKNLQDFPLRYTTIVPEPLQYNNHRDSNLTHTTTILDSLQYNIRLRDSPLGHSKYALFITCGKYSKFRFTVSNAFICFLIQTSGIFICGPIVDIIISNANVEDSNKSFYLLTGYIYGLFTGIAVLLLQYFFCVVLIDREKKLVEIYNKNIERIRLETP